MECRIILVVFAWSLFQGMEGVDFQGPFFLAEAASFVDFSNDTGVHLECKAQGFPQPHVMWLYGGDVPVTNVPRLRHVFANGSLILSPFRAEDYRQDIHATLYTCVASNSVGRIVSRSSRVRAVVRQHYEAQVYDEFVIAGNTAVLKCHIPSFLEEYIAVESWVINPEQIYPSSVAKDGKYTVMHTGELHIRDVQKQEGYFTYGCRTVHRLSGETKNSTTSGKLIITEPSSSIPPRITDSKFSVSVRQGSTAILPCVGQGFPIPTYSWHKRLADGTTVALSMNSRTSLAGGDLILESVFSSDSGTYLCIIKNNVGSEKIETTLMVMAPLSASIQPPLLVADIGKAVDFHCITSGYPIASLKWLKDGHQVVSGEKGIVLTKELLYVKTVGREDRGMYQCVIANNVESVQATAELRLGDVAPTFLFVFPEKTLHPDGVVSLKCVASGSPIPTVTWTLDDEAVPNNERTRHDQHVDDDANVVSFMNISRARVDDGGEYACAAANRVGTIHHTARVNVNGRPYIRPFRKKSIVAGRDVVIKCPYVGHPIELIQWERGGRKLPIDHRQVVFPNGTLLVRNVQRVPDAGTYSCSVRGSNGHFATRELEVMVLVPPVIIPFAFADQHVHTGMRARVICAVSQGDPPLTLAWFKDGAFVSPQLLELLSITVQNLDDYSSSLVIGSVTLSHNGNYTCTATNAAAAASYSAQLHANVPPKISPTPLHSNELHEGAQARVVCAVIDGDLPITFKWFLNGHMIKSNSRVTIRHFDEYTSVLIIGKVASMHSGNYTCVAENVADSAYFSTTLVVNVPPRWLIEPKDTQVLMEEQVVIDCQADGFPVPKITWMKAVEHAPGDYNEISDSNSRVRQLDNQSLFIHEARPQDRGHYSCRANNGVGAGISHVILLEVRVAVYFERKYRNVSVIRGHQADLLCNAKGDLPIDITWHRKKENLSVNVNPKLKIKMNKTQHGMESILTIHDSTGKDSGHYHCIAKNSLGTAEKVVHLLVKEPPGSPLFLKVLKKSSRTTSVSWAAASDSTNNLLKYLVQLKPITQDRLQEKYINITVDRTETSTTFRELQPGTAYQFRVWAINAAGQSPPSDVLSFTTTDEAPAIPPQITNVETIDSRTVRVNWKAPPKSVWQTGVLGYNVGYKVYDSVEPYFFKALDIINSQDKEIFHITISNLVQFTKYSFVIQAFNEAGPSPLSDEVIVLTSEDVPNESPDGTQCKPLTSQSIYVSWKPISPSSVNGILQGYKVFYHPAQEWHDDDALVKSKDTKDLSLIIINLEKFCNYSIEVSAYTRVGEGRRSSSIYCITMEDVPDAPSDIKVVPMTLDSVMVSWKPPKTPNGIIRNYNIYVHGVDHSKEQEIKKHMVPSGNLFFEAGGLKKNRRYEFWVTALTAVGEGQSTRVVSQSPAGPIVAAKVASFGEDIQVPWQTILEIPCRIVGIPLPEREWRYQSQLVAPDENVRISPDGALHFKYLQENHSGSYSCKASNMYGSDEITYHVKVLVPPGPPHVYVTSITEHSMVVQWRYSGSEEPAIKGYRLYYKKEFGELENFQFGVDVNSYAITGLECGARYHIYMESFNNLGTGKPSEIIYARTKGTAPRSPDGDKFLRVEAEYVALLLDEWASDSCPILYFVVQYKLLGVIEWKLVSNNVQQQPEFVIPDLTPASWYVLRVTAHNNAGSTVTEYKFSTRTLSGGTLSPLSYDFDETYSILHYRWEILGVVLAIVIVFSALVLVCILRRNKKYPTNTHYQEDLDRKTSNVTDSAALKLLQQIPDKRVGSYSSVINRSHDSKVPSKSDRSIYSEKDISPYATTQILDGNEMKIFHQRNSQIYPPLWPEYRDGTFPRTRKGTLQKCHDDSMFSAADYLNPLTEYKEDGRVYRHENPACCQLRTVHNVGKDSHVPDLLDHEQESNTSNDTSPEMVLQGRTKRAELYCIIKGDNQKDAPPTTVYSKPYETAGSPRRQTRSQLEEKFFNDCGDDFTIAV